MRKDCDTCLHDEFGETYCNDCYWAAGKPPTKWEPAPFWTPDTNADRIRAMSDEELAQMLNKAIVCHTLRSLGYCHKCPLFGANPCDTEGLLEWLKQPVKENDNG